MKNILALLVLISFFSVAKAQVYVTRTGYAMFYSSTPLEDIKAENNQLLAIVDTEKKELAFSLLMKGFAFKKELMQTHFNENYVESDKYPKASFTGKYTGDAAGKVTVSGNLTIHGVTRFVEMPATLSLQNNVLIGSAMFKVSPADYNITIPGLVKNKIANEIEVNIKIEASPK